MNNDQQTLERHIAQRISLAAPTQQLYGSALTAVFVIERLDALKGRGRVAALYNMLLAMGGVDVREYPAPDAENAAAQKIAGLVREQAEAMAALSKHFVETVPLDESWREVMAESEGVVEGLLRGICHITADLQNGNAAIGLRFPFEALSAFERVAIMLRARLPDTTPPETAAMLNRVIDGYKESAAFIGLDAIADRQSAINQESLRR